MSTTDQFLLALHAYQEIRANLHQNEPPLHAIAEVSTLETPANKVATTLPGGSLLLGLAEDGLPLLLDLYDPAPGPLLVAGDGGCGKTAFLQSLAQASDFHTPGEIQFAVLTLFPEEWSGLEALPNCLGIWPCYHSAAGKFMAQMVSWAEVLPGSHQAVLVFVDDLDLLTARGFQIQPDLRWLLVYGPERQVWPVVTVNPGRLTRFELWLAYFQTCVLGQVKNPQSAHLLAGDPKTNLAALLPGREFVHSSPEGWLKFSPPVTVED